MKRARLCQGGNGLGRDGEARNSHQESNSWQTKQALKGTGSDGGTERKAKTHNRRKQMDPGEVLSDKEQRKRFFLGKESLE